MIVSIKKFFKWGSSKTLESKKNQTSLIFAAFIGVLEDVLFWKKMWLSLSCIFLLNVIFFICIHRQISFMEFIFGLCIAIISVDSVETWLKYKHRTGCLKRLAEHDGTELNITVNNLKNCLRRQWMEFADLRETNHTKAFLLINIALTVIFLIGKYMSGYVLLYLLCMTLCVARKLAPPIFTLAKKIQQNAESDGELEGLLPEPSEMDIKLLSIEPEHQVLDDKQSLDYWKPHDMPLEEVSDSSSEHSSSLVTNLSIEKMRSLDKDVETSDSSDDEYNIHLGQQKELLQSTLEVQPASRWGGMAYNALYNLSGAVASLMYTTKEETKRKRVPSNDSSDGFEIIDKNEL